MIKKILFPVDFSTSCTAMAPFVKRASYLFGARITLVHVFEPMSRNGFEMCVRPLPEVTEEHRNLAGDKLDSFIASQFPAGECSRTLVSGDAAIQIAHLARTQGFDLIVMPTHAGVFRRMLLGSTTAKVLNDADCPVLTSQHSQTIAPRALEHRKWICAIGLSPNSHRVLRLASEAARAAGAKLTLIHVIRRDDPGLRDKAGPLEHEQPDGNCEVAPQLEELQRSAGSDAEIRIAIGPVKEALLEAARHSDADVFMIGRSPKTGAFGRMRDLTYAVTRESPVPVLSV